MNRILKILMFVFILVTIINAQTEYKYIDLKYANIGLLVSLIVISIYLLFLNMKRFGFKWLLKPFSIFSGAIISALFPNVILFIFILFGSDDQNRSGLGDGMLFLMPFSLMFFVFWGMLFYYSSRNFSQNTKLNEIFKSQLRLSSLIPAFLFFIGLLSWLLFDGSPEENAIPFAFSLLIFIYSLIMFYTGTFVWYMLAKTHNKQFNRDK